MKSATGQAHTQLPPARPGEARPRPEAKLSAKRPSGVNRRDPEADVPPQEAEGGMLQDQEGASGTPDQEEDRLVEAARTDRQAFGVLYDRHFDAVYHYVARRVGDEAVAEDLAAAVWERALQAIENYEIRGVPFVTWLYRIAGNLVANYHRRRRLWQLVPFVDRQGRSDPRPRMEERAAVQAALRQLSESDQEVLALFYYAGMSPPQIADVLGCSPAAVHKRLHRARQRLRRHLEEGESE